MIIFGGIGLLIVIGGIFGLNRALLLPFRHPGRDVVGTIETHRRRQSGPRVVAIGGGHGLAMLLRGLKKYTHRITAVVTVADDGGSSGRLRESLGIIPPGDLRKCLAARHFVTFPRERVSIVCRPNLGTSFDCKSSRTIELRLRR